MWKRRELKDYAKGFLKQNYWKAFIMLVFITIINTRVLANFSGIVQEVQINYEYLFGQGEALSVVYPTFQFFRSILSNIKPLGYLALGTSTLVIIIITISMGAFALILEIGMSRFFLDAFKGDVNIGHLFYGFNSKHFLPILKAQLLAIFYIVLWSLLLFIPGIIKSYQYRYISYILAEDTSLSTKEVLRKSKQMVKGHKWKIFILDLSFILWHLLELITFGLSRYFVAPYVEATNARLYNVLKDRTDMHYE